MVSVHMTDESCRGGLRLAKGEDYVLADKIARNLFRRGSARPSAEVYLEQLKALGVRGVVVNKEFSQQLIDSAKQIGIKVVR